MYFYCNNFNVISIINLNQNINIFNFTHSFHLVVQSLSFLNNNNRYVVTPNLFCKFNKIIQKND